MFLHDLAIIGAGPAGSFLAQKLKKKGFKPLILDSKKKIGEPIQCAGLVSISGLKETDLYKYAEKNALNKVSSARFVAGQQEFFVKGKEKKALVLDRGKFDSDLAKGLEIKKERVVGLSEKSIITNKGTIPKPKFVIGADGPLSTIRKYVTKEKPKLLHGVQRNIKGKFDSDSVELHFFPDSNFFGWIVPIDSKRARIGLADNLGENVEAKLEKFVKSFNAKPEKEIISGLIPISKPFRKINTSSIALLGDAASQVKATTGGGIVFGAKAGKKLGEAIEKGSLRYYRIPEVNNELRLHYMLARKWAEKPFSQKQELFKEIKNRGIDERIGAMADMDKASSLFKTISFSDFVALSRFLF